MLRSSRLFTALALLVAAAWGCAKKGPVPPAEIKDIVPVTVDEDGFHPNRIPAQVGRAITLVFTRKVEKTCADTVVIPSENIREALPLNQPKMVIFMPSHVGDVHFACPMNMVTGEIAVQAAPGSADDDSAPKKPRPRAKLPMAAPAAAAPPAMPQGMPAAMPQGMPQQIPQGQMPALPR